VDDYASREVYEILPLKSWQTAIITRVEIVQHLFFVDRGYLYLYMVKLSLFATRETWSDAIDARTAAKAGSTFFSWWYGSCTFCTTPLELPLELENCLVYMFGSVCAAKLHCPPKT